MEKRFFYLQQELFFFQKFSDNDQVLSGIKETIFGWKIIYNIPDRNIFSYYRAYLNSIKIIVGDCFDPILDPTSDRFGSKSEKVGWRSEFLMFLNCSD